MDRRGRDLNRLWALSACILVALSPLATAPVAFAAPAAVDEYSLAPAGSGAIDRPTVPAGTEPRSSDRPVADSLGVVGEDASAPSPLDAGANSLGTDAGTAVLLAIAALAVGASLMLRRPRERE